MFVRFSACAISASFALLCCEIPAAADPTFVVFDAPGAGTAAFQGTFGKTIDNKGNISGTISTSDSKIGSFIRRKTGKFTEFSQAGDIEPIAATPRGMIAGTYFPADGSAIQGFRATPRGEVTPFDVPQQNPDLGIQVSGINSKQVATGYFWDNNLVTHGFIAAAFNGPVTTIDAPGAGTKTEFAGTYPYSLNSHTFGTGYYIDDANVSHGFLYRYSPTLQFTEFDVPGAGTSSGLGTFALCINSKSTIVGSYADANNVRHAYQREIDGTIKTFDAENAGSQSSQGTRVSCINRKGYITGRYVDSNGTSHGYLRSPHGEMTTFDPPGAGTGAGQGTTPIDINDAGEITGSFIDNANVYHGFLRTP